MSVSVSPPHNGSERNDQMNPACPSDEVLRGILHNSNEETRSIEWLSHLTACQKCQDRILEWEQESEFKALAEAAANNQIEYLTPAPDYEIPPVRVVTAGEPDNVTNNYQEPPLRRIGNYELLKLIGTGGSGNVYRARHIHLGRYVAIKLLLPQFSGSSIARLRFFREMKSIGALGHPYIVRADDAGEYQQTLYLAMELVVGENVDSFSQRLGPLPVPDACEIIRQAAIGLQHIHENGLVHRDLKPSNLLLSKNGVKITDLGLALLIREPKTDHRLTGTETVLGTTDYMAPEQAEGSHEVDIRADLYSLGCTLFRLLAGRPPYSGAAYDTALKKMVAHASHPVPDIQKLRSDVPAGLSAIIQRLMSKDRNDRYQTPIELAHELEPFCGNLDLRKLGITAPILPHSTPRSPTAEDLTDPLKPSATKILTMDDGQVHRHFIRRWTTVGIIGTVALLMVFSLREFIRQPDIERPPVAPPIPEVAVPKKNPADQVAIPAVDPVAASPTPPSIGVIETRWRAKFGDNMKVLEWPGWKPDGAEVRFSDALQGLSFQTDKTLRLFQLGTLAEDEVVTLSVKAKSISHASSFGVFTGFKIEDSDRPKLTWFHEANVCFPESRNDHIIVMRHRGLLWAETGAKGGYTDHDSLNLLVPPDQTEIDLKVVLKPNIIPTIYIDSKECVFRERVFQDPPFSGPFGLYVHYGTVLFRDPQISRSRK